MNFLHNGSRIIIFKVYTNFGDFLQQCALFVEFNFPSRCCGEMIGAEDSSPLLDRLEANSRYRNFAEGGHHFLREVVDLVLELLRAEVQNDVLHSPVEAGHLLVNSREQARANIILINTLLSPCHLSTMFLLVSSVVWR